MEKRKHIVIDARIRRSSTGRYIDRLVEHLQKIDTFHRYTILVQPDDPFKPTAKNFTAVACPFPKFSANPINDLRLAWQLYRLKPDLVHFDLSQMPVSYFGKCVCMSHDTTMYRFVRRGSTPLPLYRLKMALYMFLVWQTHTKASKILVPTQTVANEFAERQPFTLNKLVVTLEASEPAFADKAVRPMGLQQNEKFIMYVGTAFPHKNLPGLIRGFNELHKNDPALKLVLVGKHEKHYRELIDWAAKQPSYKNIIFTGFVTDAELKWLYEHCQAYVFASLSEGFGLPPLEAMTHGAPVVSSNTSVMPEVNGDAAYYFTPTDPKDMARAVQEVLEDPALRKLLIKNGYAHLKKFSWGKMAAETLTVYKDVLEEVTT